MRILALSFWGICWKCKEGHPDKKETLKRTERRERPGKLPAFSIEDTTFCDCPENIHLIKWNASIREIWTTDLSWFLAGPNKNSQIVPYREQVSAAKVITVCLDDGKICSETISFNLRSIHTLCSVSAHSSDSGLREHRGFFRAYIHWGILSWTSNIPPTSSAQYAAFKKTTVTLFYHTAFQMRKDRDERWVSCSWLG